MTTPTRPSCAPAPTLSAGRRPGLALETVAEPGSPEWLTETRTSQRPVAASATPPSVLEGRGTKLSDAQTAQLVEQLQRDGYYFLGPTLAADEVQALRAAAERKIADPESATRGDLMSGSTLSRMFEYDRAARDLIVREPFASIAEAVLGEDCHMMSQVSRTTISKMISVRAAAAIISCS